MSFSGNAEKGGVDPAVDGLQKLEAMSHSRPGLSLVWMTWVGTDLTCRPACLWQSEGGNVSRPPLHLMTSSIWTPGVTTDVTHNPATLPDWRWGAGMPPHSTVRGRSKIAQSGSATSKLRRLSDGRGAFDMQPLDRLKSQPTSKRLNLPPVSFAVIRQTCNAQF